MPRETGARPILGPNGRKQGRGYITVESLRAQFDESIEKALGFTFLEMLVDLQIMFYKQMKAGEHLSDGVRFTSLMVDRIIQRPTTDVTLHKTTNNTNNELSTEEIDDKINTYLARTALSVEQQDQITVDANIVNIDPDVKTE